MRKPKLPFLGTNISQAHRDVAEWNKVYMMTPMILPITTPAADREDHSPIGFSSWDRHSGCIGSVAMATLFPDHESSNDASRLGDLAHHVSATWLMTGFCPKGTDTVMENNVRHYVYAIWDKLKVATARGIQGSIWMVEGRVAAPKIHKDCRGTVDSLIWDEVNKVLQIHDLKYGNWPVDAEGNPQLMGYAVCALEQWPQIKPKRIELYIHQVRLSKEPKMWAIDPLDLDMFRDEIIDTVAQIEHQKKILKKTKNTKKLTLSAGDHCHYCPAKLVCHERLDAAEKEGIDVLLPVPAKLPTDSGKLVRFALKALPFAKGVLAAAMAHLKKGGKIDGIELIQGKRVRVPVKPEWLDDELTTEVDLGGIGLAEEDLVTVPKPRRKTLAQIAGLVPPEQKKAFDKLWKWAPGAPKVAPEGTGKPYKVTAEDYFHIIEDDSEEAETEDEDI